MKKSLLPVLLVIINFLAVSAQQIIIPDNYTIKDSISGDLDKDGINELVVAYNTEKEKEEFESVPRELVIYKNQNGKWIVWKKSKQALYGSRQGGMMGDPFGSIYIDNSILNIHQNGGSSWKWGHTDKYRYQNGAFILIGYSSSYGKPCEYWEVVDFNLSTGKLIVKKEYESCEGENQEIYKKEIETFYKKGLVITLEKRSDKEIKILSPKYKHEIYVAVKGD